MADDGARPPLSQSLTLVAPCGLAQARVGLLYITYFRKKLKGTNEVLVRVVDQVPTV